MPKEESCPNAPYTEWQVKVSFEAYRQRWLAEQWATTVTAGGDVIHHGNGSKEFGPFDSFIDVQHWLASEARVLKAVGDPLKWPTENGKARPTSTTDSDAPAATTAQSEAKSHG